MPKITDIAHQKKRDQFYSIFVDEEFSFSLSDLELSLSGLSVGRELSAAEVQEWRERSVLAKAVGRAQYYLSFRPRTVTEVRRYLIGKDYEPDIVELVIAKLQAYGQLGDEQFARDWVRMRQATKPRSKRELQQELRKLGVASEVVDIVLEDQVDEVTGEAVGDVAAIVSLVTKKRLTERYPDGRKLVEYLGRKGFGYHDIKAALDQLDEA